MNRAKTQGALVLAALALAALLGAAAASTDHCDANTTDPEGTYSGAGARACTRNGTDAGLSCAAGTYIDAANGTCVACAPGTFASEANATACAACAPGKYQDTEGATACSACATGTYQGSAGATACTWCEPGTFQNVTGAAECTPCALGRSRNYSGADGCEHCFRGTYANATGSPDCTPCAPGTFAQDIASTVCTACAPGTFRNTERSSEACSPCPPNTFSPAAGAIACDSCPEGTYSGAGARACTRNGTDAGLSCAAGTYIDAANGTCVACAPGTFASEANATACAACAPGKYQDTEGATACSPCATGTSQGSAGATACTWCEPGTFQNVTGAAECTPCALGRFRNYSGADAGCEPCFWGTYANATGSPDCTPCAPGTFARDIASTVCTACAPGTFRDSERSSEACSPCPPNTFYPAAGATACAPCPEGTYSGAGARACTRNGTDAGLSCAAGTYIDAANGTCVACAPGTFASEANATVCTNCPAGTNSSAGAVTCNEDGTISNGTNTTFSATFDVSASGYDAEGNTVTLVWSTVNACPDSTEYMAVVADAPEASNCSMAAMTGVAFGEQPSSPLWSYRRQGEWGAADCYSGELMFQASLEDALACFGAGVASATHTEYLAEVVVRTNAGRSFATTTGLRVPTTVRNYTGQVQYTPGSDKMVVPGVPHVRGTRLTYDASAGRVVIRVVTTTAWPYVFDSEAGYNPGTTGWTEAGNGSAPGWKDQQYFPFSLQPTNSFVTNDGCSASRGSEGMSCEQEWDLPIERVPGAAAASKACEAVGTYGLEFRHRCSRHNGGNFSCEDIGAGVNTTTATVALDADSLCVEVFQIGRTVEERDDASPASHAAPSMAAAAMLAAATAAWALLLA